MRVAIICTALLGLLLFVLGILVSATRGSTGKAGAYPQDPADSLFKRIRAHGNTAEYVPMLAVLMLVAGERNPATWVLWTMGIATASRYLLALGILVGPSLNQAHPLRFVGALLTYVTGVMLSLAILI